MATATKRRVRMRTFIAGERWSAGPGEVVWLESGLAGRLIERSQAEPVADDPETTTPPTPEHAAMRAAGRPWRGKSLVRRTG